MITRALGMLTILGALLLPLGVPTSARAADWFNPFWGIYCKHSLVFRESFGLVARCTQISATPTERKARYGNYSPHTGEFSPTTGWMDLVSVQPYEVWTGSTDGYYGTFEGHTSVVTLFGEAVWGTQIQDLGVYGLFGRWGIYNRNSGLFYPDATGRESWIPVW